MYCVIGEKILKCEVKQKQELASICKVGATNKKDQLISNNRLFKTQPEAEEFIKNRKKNKVNENKQIADSVAACKAIYEALYEETGIEVRTIDRQWTISSAEKHVKLLKKAIGDKPESHHKDVSKSFKTAPPKKSTNKNFKTAPSKKSTSKSFNKDKKKSFKKSAK